MDYFDCTDPADGEARALAVAAAAAAIAHGGLVVIPTDTRYGVGCDAFDPLAADRLRQLRGSSRHTPTPVLVGSRRTLEGLTPHVSDAVRALVEAFWPGPLTVVVDQAPSLAWDLGDSRGTVAVRMPSHPLALALLERTGPLAVTGAHRVGWPPPRDAAAARDQLGGSVAVYLEAGPLPIGPPPATADGLTDVPAATADGQGEGPYESSGAAGRPASTVVDVRGDRSVLLREGAIDLARLREILPGLVARTLGP